MQASVSSSSPEYSLSVSRALRILSSFSQEQPELGLSEISRMLSLSKTSVARFLQALEMHGFVDQNPQSRKYRPGPETARVGSLYSGAGLVKQIALPLMQDLVRRFGFTSYLSALKDDQMLILFSVEGTGPIKYIIPVGTKLPVHSTATGKAALAQLEPDEVDGILARTGLDATTKHTITQRAVMTRRLAEIRARGFSTNWEERTVGIASVAAPVRNYAGQAMCFLSIGFATSQVKREQLASLGGAVSATAADLGARLEMEGIRDVV
jgi:DNA-binding IclR family transcriptional regulator